MLDPFAGGGAIPLEAMRLGCEVTASDINPVAWFILRWIAKPAVAYLWARTAECGNCRAEKQVPALNQREAEQAIVAVFLHSQPIGHKANTPELMRMVGAGAPDGIELEKALGGWRDFPGSSTTPTPWTMTRGLSPSPGVSATVPT